MPKKLSVEQLLRKGNALVKKGQSSDAAQLFQSILSQFPGNTKARKALAELNVAKASSPDVANRINELNHLLGQNRLHDAQVYGEALLLEIPNVAVIPNILGIVYLNLGQTDKAISTLQQAIRIDPRFPAARNSLGVVYERTRHYDKAVDCFRKAIKLQPEFAEAHFNLGNTLTQQSKNSEAVSAFKTALKLKPNYVKACNNLGNSQRNLGFREEAIASYEQALQKDPHYTEAHLNLSTVKIYTADDAQVAVMLDLLSSSGLDVWARINLHFALSKAFDDVGEYDKAFSHLEEANRLRKAQIAKDDRTSQKLIQNIKGLFRSNVDLSGLNEGDVDSSTRPIFIVGMPRSGTTLVEQILASHSEVFGAGELMLLTEELVKSIGDPAINTASSLDAAKLKSLREGYFAGVSALDIKANCMTDKMPLNFRWIGYIALAFPEAKIVAVKRNPVATCFSIYKHYFTESGNSYAYDMQDILEFYQSYLDLMELWQSLYPGRIFEVDYERLTQEQETETRKLLEYCDLDWEEQCLAFYETNREVQTASANQVRHRIYQGSSEAWRNYEQHLRPFTDVLA